MWVCVGMQEFCVCWGGLTGAFTNRVSLFVRLWGWGGGIGGALQKGGEINGRSEVDERDGFHQTRRGKSAQISPC